MSEVHVRQLQPDDWQLYREVRLSALGDAASAFSSILAGEQGLAEEVWRSRLASGLCVVAFRHEPSTDAHSTASPVGLAGCYVDEEGAHLVSMWVAREARGTGAADALIADVCQWAASDGHLTVALWVVEGNAAAERVYARNGFVRTGRVQPVRAGEPAMELEMIRLLPEPRQARG